MAHLRIGERWEHDPTTLLLRPFDGTTQDLAALAEVRNETLRATTLPEDYQEATPEDIANFYRRGDFSLVGNAWLMFQEKRPVAAAIVYPMAAFHDRPPGNFHLYVVPPLWGHSIGSRLLAHLEQAAIARGHPVLETTVAREDEPSVGFLTGHKFGIVGHALHLSRVSLSDLAQPELPEGFAIKSLAQLEEAPSLYIEAANRLGSYDPYYSLISGEELDELMAADKWDAAGAFFLFDPNQRIIGVIRASQIAPAKGYLHEIRLEPASRGRGLGTAMVARALGYLANRKVEQVELDTASENSAARNLALRAGFKETRHWLHFLKQLRVIDPEKGS